MVAIPQRDLDNTVLVFGKYKGQTPMQILEHDPHYLVWCYENVEDKICSKELYEEAEEKKEDMDFFQDTPNFYRG